MVQLRAPGVPNMWKWGWRQVFKQSLFESRNRVLALLVSGGEGVPFGDTAKARQLNFLSLASFRMLRGDSLNASPRQGCFTVVSLVLVDFWSLSLRLADYPV